MQTQPGWEHGSVKRAYMRDIKNNIQKKQLKRSHPRDDPPSIPKVQCSSVTFLPVNTDVYIHCLEI